MGTMIILNQYKLTKLQDQFQMQNSASPIDKRYPAAPDTRNNDGKR